MSHIGIASYTARQRLAEVLITLARTVGQETAGGVTLDITNEELSNAANITLFTASRLISEWHRNRALVKRRGKILLRSPDWLLSQHISRDEQKAMDDGLSTLRVLKRKQFTAP
jgi:fructose-specific phosphotransferase system component IIB